MIQFFLCFRWQSKSWAIQLEKLQKHLCYGWGQKEKNQFLISFKPGFDALAVALF